MELLFYLIGRTLQLQSQVELGQLCQDDPVRPCVLLWNTVNMSLYFSQLYLYSLISQSQEKQQIDMHYKLCVQKHTKQYMRQYQHQTVLKGRSCCRSLTGCLTLQLLEEVTAENLGDKIYREPLHQRAGVEQIKQCSGLEV